MTYAITLFSSAIFSFFAHHFGEKFLTRNRTRKIRLIIKGYQIHHSFWGIVAATIGLVFASGWLTLAILGYSLGNIWQHKVTHNQVNERGLVFISKVM